MKEEIIGFGKNASLVGVLTPARAGIERRDIGVVFLNAGIIHKIGPNRLYVKLARCFAREGFTCFRFDFSGIGDSRILNSNEPNIFDPMFEVGQAMDCLQITTGIAKFILLGVCSGAEMAFRAASRDTRIIGLSLIDGIYLDNQVLNYIYPQAVQRTRIRYYKKHLFSLKRWSKLLSGKSKLSSNLNAMALLNRFAGLLKQGNNRILQTGRSDIPGNDIFKIEDWVDLMNKGVKIHLIFCEGGTAIDVYNLTSAKSLQAYNNTGLLQTVLIKGVDHTFTPLSSQEYLIDLTLNWLLQQFKPSKKEVLNCY